MLALFALALQFAVAFGHIHLKTGQAPLGAPVAVRFSVAQISQKTSAAG